MTAAIPVGGAFLPEILACGEKADVTPSPEMGLAFTISENWRRAVSGGVSDFFSQRLAVEGFTEAEAVARLERGLGRLARETPRWLLLLRHVLPEQAAADEVPQLLAGHVARVCRGSFFAPLFSPTVTEALARQLADHVGELLDCAGVAPGARAWELFADRPFLARLVATRTSQWIRSCARLAQRLRRDRYQLEENLLAGDRIHIAEVKFGLSDRHGDGETVVRLVTDHGRAFYYKPRSMEPERVLSTFFAALDTVGLRLPPLPTMLVRPGYGWVLEVPRASLQDRKQLQRWFLAAGKLAAVAWLLGLTDLHWENVVAGEEGPVVVDGEAWCRPQTCFDREEAGGVLSSGLVTFPVNGPRGVRDDGALLGGIRPEAQSLPLFCGRTVDPLRFRQEVVAGARAALSLLLWAWRRGQLHLPFNDLVGLRVRWVARPSEAYAAFLRSALQNPRVQQSWQVSVLAETRWRAFLAAGTNLRSLVPLLHTEDLALHSFSIPRFTLPANRRGGVVLRSGKDRMLHRLSQLDESFIERQLTLLAAAFPRPGAGPKARLREAAREVAAVLQHGEGAQDPETGPFLRRGSAGRAVAWAAWAKVSGDEEARKRALWHVARLVHQLEREDFRQWLPGFGSGLGGVVYALSCCGQWLETPKLVKLASEVAGQALESFTVRDHLDVEAGMAGLLLGAAAVPGSERAPLLERLAHELVGAVAPANAEDGGGRMLGPGFAHGVSGVAAALLRVSQATGNRRWAEQAVGFLEREPRAGSWLAEAEVRSGAHLAVSLNGWCHGPAGALVARELVPVELRTPQLAQHIREAQAQVVPLKLATPLSLCCGSIARSEISLIVGELAGDEHLMDEARQLAGLLASSGSWREELDPKGGLLEGLPGLLFHLSRLLGPREVGSVLVGQVEGGLPWK